MIGGWVKEESPDSLAELTCSLVSACEIGRVWAIQMGWPLWRDTAALGYELESFCHIELEMGRKVVGQVPQILAVLYQDSVDFLK